MMAKITTWDGTKKKFIEINAPTGPTEAQIAEELQNKKNLKRARRNTLISNTDWAVLSDAPLTEEQVNEAKTYRTALRNLPAHEDFPDVDFPAIPSFIQEV